MRLIKSLVAGLSMVLLLSTGASFAGSDLNEVGAMLVFPAVIALNADLGGNYETYVTITNASSSAVFAHVSFIDGQKNLPLNPPAAPNTLPVPNPKYCYECDFSIPLSGNDTEMLTLNWDALGGLSITSEPDGPLGTNSIQHTCDQQIGMIIVTIEDASGNTLTDNVLLGSEVIVNYTAGWALSMPAIPFQGGDANNGDRSYNLDDNEYGKMPRIVAADFIAPALNDVPGQLTAELVLFTLNFTRQFVPFTDCSITGYDADENPFSRSIQFGCWDWFDLEDVTSEFAHPNLGLSANANDTHGWLQLNCSTVGNTVAAGGVHGAIVQRIAPGASVRRDVNAAGAAINAPNAVPVANAAAWGRLLYQSVTTGDAVTLVLEGTGAGLN